MAAAMKELYPSGNPKTTRTENVSSNHKRATAIAMRFTTTGKPTEKEREKTMEVKSVVAVGFFHLLRAGLNSAL